MKLIACGIFKRELEKVQSEAPDIFAGIETEFLTPALHVSLAALEKEVTSRLEIEPQPALLYGCNCHPELKEICREANCLLPQGVDCAQVLAGKEFLQEISQGSNDFYLTPGWLEHADEIFKHGLGWDSIDARQNLGFYDRMVLLDTDVRPIDDLEILGFYDYCQVPIERVALSLQFFKQNLLQMLSDRKNRR
ncbi:DUF1638 domain-containing protein [Metallumcola ferriviriculae]|uniref:DUF1638 domain-containing protein n=1 Tax=Metallumcola ferriviriculae TaxID=3039180 RepID=A0AAU0UPI3_9FIRM|nr:DUF1638 domain-containing protein [Desulfitibacteraceae bacterium MK1]